MSYSLYFLTASWLAAQAPAPGPVMVQVVPAPTVEHGTVYPNGATWQDGGRRSERRGLFTRLQEWLGGLFGRNRQAQPQPVPMQGNPGVIHQPVNTSEPPLAVPQKTGAATPSAPVTLAGHIPEKPLHRASDVSPIERGN